VGLAPKASEIRLAKAFLKRGVGKGVFHVDHCHDRGHVRGLLCHNCNVGIGNFQHDTAVLESAIQYLNQTMN
jgi:hypothetical protein